MFYSHYGEKAALAIEFDCYCFQLCLKLLYDRITFNTIITKDILNELETKYVSFVRILLRAIFILKTLL